MAGGGASSTRKSAKTKITEMVDEQKIGHSVVGFEMRGGEQVPVKYSAKIDRTARCFYTSGRLLRVFFFELNAWTRVCS
jgi:hypothetical protein